MGGQMIASKTASGYSFYARDHLSVRAVLPDANPNNYVEQRHMPFGESWYGTGNKWKFTSYERDADVGDDFALARRYQYTYGRFSSADPIFGDPTNPQSWNRYTYALNDPINLLDPLGLNVWACNWGGNDWDDPESDGGASQSECEAQGGSWEAVGGQVNETVNVTADIGQPPTALDLWYFGLMWRSGLGPLAINYGPNDGMTKQLAGSGVFDKMIRQEYKKLGCPSISPGTGTPMSSTHLGPWLEGFGHANPALMQVGGFVAWGQTVGNTTSFTIVNVAGMGSLTGESTLVPIVNKLTGLNADPYSLDNPNGIDGRYHNIVQTFTWTEANLCKQAD